MSESIRTAPEERLVSDNYSRPNARIGDEVRRLYGTELATTPKRAKPKKFTKLEAQACAAAVVLMLIFAGGAVFYFNEFVFYDEKCWAELSQIEKEYQRRADLIPALVEVAGEYAQHEARLFNYVADTHSLSKSVDSLRKSLGGLSGSAGASAAKSPAALQSALGRLMALAEQYPSLKAMQSYKDLMDKLETTEDRVATMRENYIRSVRQYNTLRETFPSGVFNQFYGFKRKEYYGAEQTMMPRLAKEGSGGVRVLPARQPKPAPGGGETIK